MNNFVRLYCDISEHWLWTDPVKLKWWLDLLLMAQRPSPGCEAGEIPMGVTDLARRWGSSKATVYRFLCKLSESGLVRQRQCEDEADLGKNRLIVCDPEPYLKDRSSDSAGTTARKQRKTSRKPADVPSDEEKLSPEQQAFMDALRHDYPSVMGMRKPLTYEQCTSLASDGYTREQIRGVLSQMENYSELKSKYVSAYLTASNWLKRTK